MRKTNLFKAWVENLESPNTAVYLSDEEIKRKMKEFYQEVVDSGELQDLLECEGSISAEEVLSFLGIS